MEKLQDLVRGEIYDYLHNEVEVVPGYYFDTYETIKRIHLYDASQFEDGSEYDGLMPLFFNVVHYRRDNVARFLDFDTNDIRVEELNPQSEVAAMLLQYQLRKYLKEKNYTAKINEMANYLATYGSVVLEKRKDGDKLVDLRRLFFDPSVNNLQESRFVTIKMYLTEDELREHVSRSGWDKDAVEMIISKKKALRDSAQQSYEDEGTKNEIRSAHYFEVYKRWGVMPKYMLDGKGSDRTQVKTFSVIAEPNMTIGTGKDTKSNGEVLYSAEWKKDSYPFEECHLIKVMGRWLGVGIYELLFPTQQRFNELMHQRRVSGQLSSMHLFQTADSLVYNNLLNDLQNGDVIKTQVQGSLQPIVNEERNLAYSQVEEESYTRNADALAFRNDIISGEIPSSMPATNALIAQNNIVAVHLIKRQNFVNFVRRFLVNNVIPELTRSVSEDTILRYIGDVDSLQVLDKNIKGKMLLEKAIERNLAGSPVFDFEREEMETQIEKEMAEMGSKRFYKFIKGYYNDKKYDIDINIDAEQRDVDKEVQNTFSFIQAFVQNPEALQNDVIKEFAYKVGRDIGIDTGRLEMAIAKQSAKQTTQPQIQPTAGRNVQALVESQNGQNQNV